MEGDDSTMDDILVEKEIAENLRVYVAPLSRQSIKDSDAAHLGYEGFFIFEACDSIESKGITVLAKAVSFEAALRLSELLDLMSISPPYVCGTGRAASPADPCPSYRRSYSATKSER